MKHKQFEKWILDEQPLDASQKMALEIHLRSCGACRSLQAGWVASKQLIAQSVMHAPAAGFSQRWQQTVIKKCQIEKVRRYRIAMFLLVVIAFAGAVTYMIATGTVMQYFANGIAILSDLIIKVTTGLSTVGFWFNRLPLAIPLSIGFFIFGLFSAMMMAAVFFLWNLKQRKLQANEIIID
jgi:hypothetical protein